MANTGARAYVAATQGERCRLRIFRWVQEAGQGGVSDGTTLWFSRTRASYGIIGLQGKRPEQTVGRTI